MHGMAVLGSTSERFSIDPNPSSLPYRAQTLRRFVPMPTAIHRFVEQARRGELPRVICRTRAGWVVLGNPQVVRGYCLLLPDPVVASLNDLKDETRRKFLDDMVSVGDALLE